jgi:hypothetical protein
MSLAFASYPDRKDEMLTITIQPTWDGTTFKLDGKVIGPWVQNLERLWQHAREHALHRTVRVDLTSVLLVDRDGKRVLKLMHEDGVELMAKDSVMKSLIENGVSGTRSTAIPSEPSDGSKRR